MTLVAGRSRDLSRLDSVRREATVLGLDGEALIEPLVIDQPMRNFARAAVEKSGGQARQRQQALIDDLIDPEALHLTYQWGHTGTTAEVFTTGEANCLAFTNLFIGMARAVGLPVYYLLVRDGETFRKEDDLVIVSDHVAVGYGYGDSRMIIDLAAEPEADLRRLKPISDLTALALYYTNRGAEALRRDEIEDALEQLRTAVALDAEMASIWINYGVALRRNGQPRAAEDAYRRALDLDPRARSALVNLASLLRMEDRLQEAKGLEAILARSPGRNPFTYLALGDISLANGRPEEAARLYRRAIGLNRQSAEAWAALGRAALAQGNRDAARRALRKARKRDQNHPRIALLERALAAGG
jgi:tetratricopeptide (TPR) repeat protein